MNFIKLYTVLTYFYLRGLRNFCKFLSLGVSLGPQSLLYPVLILV